MGIRSARVCRTISTFANIPTFAQIAGWVSAILGCKIVGLQDPVSFISTRRPLTRVNFQIIADVDPSEIQGDVILVTAVPICNSPTNITLLVGPIERDAWFKGCNVLPQTHSWGLSVSLVSVMMTSGMQHWRLRKMAHYSKCQKAHLQPMCDNHGVQERAQSIHRTPICSWKSRFFGFPTSAKTQADGTSGQLKAVFAVQDI